MPNSPLGFIHRYVPATERGGRVLLLLHGTGGDEQDLLPLGASLDPGAALLSPRGQVLERGAARFFRRLAPGVFDVPDLVQRTRELAEFIRAAAATYDFAPEAVVAVGLSNGANIAASLLLLHPGLIGAAVLFRPMMPLEPERVPSLAGTPVFIGAGLLDPMISEAQTEHLADYLRKTGARVTLDWQRAGHALTPADVDAARAWLASPHDSRARTTGRAP